MDRIGPYEFRFAATAMDREQIHRLNYQTFVRELPQHADAGDGRLVDKFDAKNQYLMAVKDSALVGMLAAHDQPPFSIADRMPDASVLSSPGVVPVEIRLLAVVPEERKSPVMMGLVWALYQHAKGVGYTHFVMSGVVEQQGLYTRLGFEPLGPAVGHGRASFVPMWLPVSRLEQSMGRTIALLRRRAERAAASPGNVADLEMQS